MPVKIRIFIFVCLLVWCAGIFYQPLMHADNNLIYSYPFIKKIYSMFCHQDSHKLFNIFGYQTLTCSRCTGIYLGALTGSFFCLFISLQTGLKIRRATGAVDNNHRRKTSR